MQNSNVHICWLESLQYSKEGWMQRRVNTNTSAEVAVIGWRSHVRPAAAALGIEGSELQVIHIISGSAPSMCTRIDIRKGRVACARADHGLVPVASLCECRDVELICAVHKFLLA